MTRPTFCRRIALSLVPVLTRNSSALLIMRRLAVRRLWPALLWHSPCRGMHRYTPHRLALAEPRPTLMVPQWIDRRAAMATQWRANRVSGGPRSPTLIHSPLPRDQTAGAHAGSLGCRLVTVARHERHEAPLSSLATTVSSHRGSVCGTVMANARKLLKQNAEAALAMRS